MPLVGAQAGPGLRAAPRPREPAFQSLRACPTAAAVDLTPALSSREPEKGYEPSELPRPVGAPPCTGASPPGAHLWGRTTLPATGPGEPQRTALAGLWADGCVSRRRLI